MFAPKFTRRLASTDLVEVQRRERPELRAQKVVQGLREGKAESVEEEQPQLRQTAALFVLPRRLVGRLARRKQSVREGRATRQE